MNKLIQFLKDRWQDLATGYFYGLFVALPWLGALALITAVPVAVLWTLAGMGFLGTNTWRRLGVPLLVSSAYSFHAGNIGTWIILSAGLQVAMQYQGWSVPDVNQPKASPIGTFWWERYGRPPGGIDRMEVDILTRGTWMLGLFIATGVMFIR